MAGKDFLLKEHIDKFLSGLPIGEHIKEWKIIHHSTLKPAKLGVKYPWHLLLHTHYKDANSNTMYVTLGVKTK